MGLFGFGKKLERQCDLCPNTGRDFADLTYSGEWAFYRGHVVGWCDECKKWICEDHREINPGGRGARCLKCKEPLSSNY